MNTAIILFLVTISYFTGFLMGWIVRGTKVKVVGDLTRFHQPVVDREMVVNIIKDNCKSFWKLSRNKKVTPYKIGRLADAIILGMYGGK